MNNMLLKIYDLFRSHRMMGAVSFIIITSLLVLSFLNLNYKEDISDFLPVDNNHQSALKVYQDISGANKIIAMFEYSDTANIDYDQMVNAVDIFVEYLQANDSCGYITDLTYKVEEEHVSNIIDFVYNNIPYFLTKDDIEELDSIVNTPNFVSIQLEQAKQMLMLPSGGFLTNNIQRDPLNLFTPIVSSLSQTNSKITLNSYEEYILTPDSKRMIVMMTSPFGNSETNLNSNLVSLLNEAKDITHEKYPSTYIRLTGGPIIAVGNSSQIKIDSIISIALAIVLILLLLLYCFRNFRNILLIVVSISWGWLFAIAGLALIHDNISLIVIGISSVILGIAVNYPLHLIAHLSHTATVKSALKEIITPLLIGNITTVCAFCSLIPLDSKALSDLGLFSALLLIGTIIFVIIYLPHIINKKENSTETEDNPRDLLSKISNISIKNNKYILGVIVVITLVFAYYSSYTSFDSNMSNINYMNDEQRENMAYFQKLTQGIDNSEQNIYLVSSDSTFDGALSKSEKIVQHLENITFKDTTIRNLSCTKFITSKEEQNRRIERWHTFLDKNREILINELDANTALMGFTNDAFDEFKTILYKQHNTNFDNSPLKQIFQSNFSQDSLAHIFNVVDIISVPRCKTDNIQRQLKEICSEQYCFNIQELNSVMSKNLSDNFNYIGWACGIIVFIFLWISFGRLELALLAFCPMAISWIWILGLMGLFGIQFNIVNVILATFIFGQGDDYTIFITEGCMYEYAYRKKMLNSYRKSIIISALIMFIGIGTLIFAKHPALYSLAQVTIIGMFSVVLISFIMPPLIFKWITMKNGAYRKRPLRISSSLRTLYCAIIWISQVVLGCIIVAIMHICGNRSLKSKEWYHKLISRTQKLDLKIIPGINLTIINEEKENFEKPCIIICNHKSMLDPAYIQSLSHKILIVTNEQSSLYPLINGVFKWFNFHTVYKNDYKDWADSCFDKDLELFRDYINAGYSIAIFPEGIRNPNTNIARWHEESFYLAKELNVDLLPIFIHGLNEVMPIGSFEMNANPVTMVIKKRITSISDIGNNDCSIKAKNIHKYYITEYTKLSQDLESANYYAPLVKNRYLYKSASIYSTICSHLKYNYNYDKLINDITDNKIILINGCGYGELSLLIALVLPKSKIYAYDEDEMKLDIAISSADGLVNNLNYINVLDLSDYNNPCIINLDKNGRVIL